MIPNNVFKKKVTYKIFTSIKPANSEDLLKKLEKEGYSVIVKTVKMGARGFVAGTQYQFLGQMGIKGCNWVKCIRHLEEITKILRCGYGIKEISHGTIQNKDR